MECRARIKNKRILSERIEKFISPLYFADVNLYSRLYSYQRSIQPLYHTFTDSRISFEEATADCRKYEVSLGENFGPTWSTHWFKADVDLSIEPNWRNKEVRFRWNSNSEAMVWIDGEPKQGLTGGDGQVRTDFILTDSCSGRERCGSYFWDANCFSLYIEMAANGMFGAGKDGMINAPDADRTFSLSMAEVAVMDRDVYSIIKDLKVIIDIAENLPEDSDISANALQVGCDAVNCCQPMRENSLKRSKETLDGFFGVSGDNPTNRHTYNIHAIGHCHIDTAWLWPYAETERKCARSWSSAIGLMDRHPEFKFACSQAVQLLWVKMKYPSLFKKIKNYANRNQFLPTGGTWVEMDGNIPSGESFMRQFLYGQQFFKKEFGHYCDVFWLPDTFGYSAQLPQIIRQSGIKYFLTQKISWSLVNKFPHNSFLWQGIDGSRCLTHFPPADTYESSVTFKDVLKTSTQNKDKGIVSDGMLLYGYGDGGGGPTEEMIDNINRLGHIPGLPRIEHSGPTEFFSVLERSSHLLHVWVGELYLELHQGTFTSQALVKKRNRECEMLLRNTEFLNTWAHLKSPNIKISSTVDIGNIWKKLLLNQFHDVLPGTSIKQVYDDAEKLYQEIIFECSQLNKVHHNILFHDNGEKTGGTTTGFLNSNPWPREEVIMVDENQLISNIEEKQPLHNGAAIMVKVVGMGYTCIDKEVKAEDRVFIRQDTTDNTVRLENNQLSAVFNDCGQMLSCILKQSKRECIKKGSHGNLFALYTDIPLFWDAWDVMPYNEETRDVMKDCRSIKVLDHGPLRVGFQVSLRLSDKSSLTQYVCLDAGSDFIRFDTKVDWHENRKILKVEFPFSVHTDHATYEIQCGHLRRPTHCNTSWDWAKHEVCGHKWVDFSEYDFGVAVISDCKYGFSAYGSSFQISLLRSPKAPDNQADMGQHSFSYAVMPHAGSFQQAQVIRRAYDFNNPIQVLSFPDNPGTSASLLNVDNPAVIIEAVKIAENDTGHVIVRLYESFGGHAGVVLTSLFPFKDVFRVNVLEEREDSEDNRLNYINEYKYSFSMKPFEIITLCLLIG